MTVWSKLIFTNYNTPTDKKQKTVFAMLNKLMHINWIYYYLLILQDTFCYKMNERIAYIALIYEINLF